MAAWLPIRAHASFRCLAAVFQALFFSSLPFFSTRGVARTPSRGCALSPLCYSCGPFTMAGILFEDIFDVKDIDPEGKKFDRGK